MDPALATLGAFFLTSLAIELTPGPNMAYLALVGVSRGRADGLMAVAGVALGLALLGAIVGVGLGSLILENRLVYEVLRWAGAAYLIWLAYDGWRDSRAPLENRYLPDTIWIYFRRGFATNLLNPKAALFFVSVLPSFIDRARPLGGQSIILVTLYVIAATLIHSAIVLLASPLSPYFRRPAWRQGAGIVFGIALVVVAIWLLVRTSG